MRLFCAETLGNKPHQLTNLYFFQDYFPMNLSHLSLPKKGWEKSCNTFSPYTQATNNETSNDLIEQLLGLWIYLSECRTNDQYQYQQLPVDQNSRRLAATPLGTRTSAHGRVLLGSGSFPLALRHNFSGR